MSWQDKICTRSGTITITRLLTITNPSATGQYETGQLTVALSGTAAEPLKVAPTWRNEQTGKGGKAQLGAGKTSWSIKKVTLVGGENPITVNGTVGTTPVSDRIVVRADDHAGPTVTITSPRANSTTRKGAIKLSGKAKDNVGVAAVDYLNRTTGYGGRCRGTTSWSASNVGLAVGRNEIEITATDGAGNTRTTTVVMTYQP